MRQLANILTVLFIGLISAAYASAQMVLIENNAGEKRKICMYKNETINLKAKRCFTMNAGETATWNREGADSKFKVKIFKPRLIDKYLYTRTLPGDTKVILIGEDRRFGFSRDERKPKKVEYTLRVCNQNYREIYVALAFEVNNETSSHGWWGIKKRACVNVAVSELMKKTSEVEFGNFPKTYFYAKEYGSRSNKEWTGGDRGRLVCINTKTKFALRQILQIGNGGLRSAPCDPKNGKKIFSFRTMKENNLRGNTYFLTF